MDVLLHLFLDMAHVLFLLKLLYHSFLPFLSFGIDSVATFTGLWSGGIVSRYVFIIMFVVAMVVLIRIIPKSINAVTKAKELETEKLVLNTQLTESRVSTMMSQIRPHFIYNTLDDISWLIKMEEYDSAVKLVYAISQFFKISLHNGDKYILIEEEIEHLQSYIDIQNIRYPGKIEFNLSVSENIFLFLP